MIAMKFITDMPDSTEEETTSINNMGSNVIYF